MYLEFLIDCSLDKIRHFKIVEINITQNLATILTNNVINLKDNLS